MRRSASPEPVQPRLVSLDKAAAYVDTSTRTNRRAISEGRLRGYRFGPRLLRVDLNEIDTILGRVPTVGMK
jgi:excisionase family DNA binding protein